MCGLLRERASAIRAHNSADMFHALTVRATTRFLFAAVLSSYFSSGSRVHAQGQTLSAMDHKSWTARDGAPRGVQADRLRLTRAR